MWKRVCVLECLKKQQILWGVCVFVSYHGNSLVCMQTGSHILLCWAYAHKRKKTNSGSMLGSKRKVLRNEWKLLKRGKKTLLQRRGGGWRFWKIQNLAGHKKKRKQESSCLLEEGLRIRIRSDPVFLHESGSGFQISLDPDPDPFSAQIQEKKLQKGL